MYIKRLIHIFILLAFALVIQARPFILVIDAGHGGHDAGAVGEFSKEKDINLRVALAFGKYVENNMPNVKVIYTRKTDVFVPLIERANIANKNHANAFVSIHTNSVPEGRLAYGIETYAMGLRRSNEKFSAALRENNVITYEKNYKEKYDGYDPKSPESLIMFELMHDNNMSESVSLAKYIQGSVCSETGRQSKGVKQDVFLVLRETSMPACLVELGFISTPEEEQFLNSSEGVDKLARGIYKGFANFSKQGGANVASSGVVAGSQKSASQKPSAQNTQKPATSNTQKPVAQPKKTETKPAEKKTETKPTQKPAEKKTEAKPAQKPTEKKAETKPATPVQKPAFDPNLKSTYKVVIVSSSSPVPAGDARFKGRKDAKHFLDNGVHRYTILDTSNRQEAYNMRAEVVKDFPQAFVITLQNGVRVK